MREEKAVIEKTLLLLRDLSLEIQQYEAGHRETVSLDFYLDEISRQAAKIVLSAYDGDMEPLDALAESLQDQSYTVSPIAQMVLDAFALTVSTVSSLIGREMNQDLDAWSRSLSEERTFKSLVNWISNLCEKDDTFSAILLSSRILAHGFASIVRGDVEGLGAALDYYNLLTFRLYDPHDIESAPLKFFLYVSNLLLTNVAMLRGGLVETMERYRRKMRTTTKIAEMLERSMTLGSVPRISMAIATANKLAAKLATMSIRDGDDWKLLRELNEVHWLTTKLADARNVQEVRALQSNLEAAIHIIRGSERDLELAHEVIESGVRGESDEAYREAAVGVTTSAAKLLFLGLSKQADRLREYMKSRVTEDRLGGIHKVNVDFLSHLDRISKKRGKGGQLSKP
ncbi:MAG: hypothetical protein ACE5KH_01590 [Candidatus Geothermarchaeales archaeon]